MLTVDVVTGDVLLGNDRRRVLAGLVVVRLVTFVGPLFALSSATDLHSVTVTALGALILLPLLSVLARPLVSSPRAEATALMLDAATAATVTVAVALHIAEAGGSMRPDVLWTGYTGAVVLWTSWWGPRAGLLLVAASVPLQLFGKPFPPDSQAVRMMAGCTFWLVLWTFLTWITLTVLWHTVRAARKQGVVRGRRAEQLRTLRLLHDSTIQTLDSIRLISRAQNLPMEERLWLVAGAADREASELRTTLQALDEGTPQRSPTGTGSADEDLDLDGVLRATSDELARAGIRVEVDPPVTSGVRLPRPRVEALRMGTREALLNAARHADASRLRVGINVGDATVEVLVADDGRGFAGLPAAGFGITHSIVGRLVEVGGAAEIWSEPGTGTTVRMCVPRRSAP